MGGIRTSTKSHISIKLIITIECHVENAKFKVLSMQLVVANTFRSFVTKFRRNFSTRICPNQCPNILIGWSHKTSSMSNSISHLKMHTRTGFCQNAREKNFLGPKSADSVSSYPDQMKSQNFFDVTFEIPIWNCILGPVFIQIREVRNFDPEIAWIGVPISRSDEVAKLFRCQIRNPHLKLHTRTGFRQNLREKIVWAWNRLNRCPDIPIGWSCRTFSMSNSKSPSETAY